MKIESEEEMTRMVIEVGNIILLKTFFMAICILSTLVAILTLYLTVNDMIYLPQPLLITMTWLMIALCAYTIQKNTIIPRDKLTAIEEWYKEKGG